MATAILDRIINGAVVLRIVGKSGRVHRAQDNKRAPRSADWQPVTGSVTIIYPTNPGGSNFAPPSGWFRSARGDSDAAKMVASLRDSKLLAGFRGAQAADVAALRDALLGVSALVSAVPEIAELDLNPVKFFLGETESVPWTPEF